MWQESNNLTQIVIANIFENTKDSYDLNLVHILEADNPKRVHLLQLPKRAQWLICGCWWFLILVATYFRSIVYIFIYNQHKSSGLTPINQLVLFITSIQHLVYLSISVSGTMMIYYDSSLDQVTNGNRIVLFQNYRNYSLNWFLKWFVMTLNLTR